MEPAPLPPPAATAIPQPPPAVAAPLVAPRPPVQSGDLTTGWRTTMALAWVGIVVGLSAVWWASRKLGMSTWWLGPSTEPRIFLVTLVPLLAPVVTVTAVLRKVRYAPLIGILAGVLTAAVGVGDIGRVPGLAAVEIALGTAGVLASAAALTGMYRAA
jgi:uncharacterized transporter YbjL